MTPEERITLLQLAGCVMVKRTAESKGSQNWRGVAPAGPATHLFGGSVVGLVMFQSGGSFMRDGGLWGTALIPWPTTGREVIPFDAGLIERIPEELFTRFIQSLGETT